MGGIDCFLLFFVVFYPSDEENRTLFKGILPVNHLNIVFFRFNNFGCIPQQSTCFKSGDFFHIVP